MPYGIDTGVQPMHSSSSNPPFNPIQAEAQPFQLTSTHNAVLTSSQFGNPNVQRPSLLRPVDLTAVSRLGGHGAMMSPSALRVVRSV